MSKQIIQALLAVLVSAGSAAWADTELFTCSESGSDSTYLKVCVADTGNVTLFKSPWGMEHVRVDMTPPNDLYLEYGALEGFDVCYWDPDYWYPGEGNWNEYYDFGGYYPEPEYRASWNWRWDAPYKIEQPSGPGKFPLRIYRKTDDGVFDLKQEFDVDPVEREIRITMTLHNISNKVQRKVQLIRAVSLNIDNTSEDVEPALFGKRAVVQTDSGLPDGGKRDAVSLAALTTAYPVGFNSLYLAGAPDTGEFCYSGPYNGHFSDGATIGGVGYWFGDLPAGASRTVKFAYRAF